MKYPLSFWKKTVAVAVLAMFFANINVQTVLAEEASSNSDEVASESSRSLSEPSSNSEASESETSSNASEEQEVLENSSNPTPEEFFGKRIWDSFGLTKDKEAGSESETVTEEENIDRNLPLSNPVYTDYIFGKNTSDKQQNLKGLEGQYTTSLFTGAATYTYPIELPSGRSGLTPSISLLYNSQNNRNDGVMGYGWDLSESYIERSDRKGVNNMYSLNEFRVKMNGGQSDIVPVSLIDQSHGEYGERIAENFWKYTFNTDDSWTIFDKKGTRYTFGASSESRQDDPSDSSKIYRWYPTEIRDTNDNFIRYAYFEDSGRLYLNAIYYTGHGSSDGLMTIAFRYESRSDVAKSYRSGFFVQTNYRIDTVDVFINGYANGNPVRTYAFEYGTGDNGVRSILTRIQETGRNENGDSASLPPTTFQYYNNAETAIGWTKESASIQEALGCNGDTKIFDVNHDAYDDIVRSYKYSYAVNQGTVTHVYINAKNKTWTNQDSMWNFPEYFTMYVAGDDALYIYNLLDFDGDFRIDLGEGTSFQNEQTYSVYYLTDTGWLAGPGYENIDGWNDYDASVPDYGRRQMDINSDGFTDLIRGYYNEFGSSGSCNAPGFIQEVRINDVSQKTFLSDTSYYNPFPFAYESDCWGYTNYDPGFRIVDVNGDGLSDVVYSYFRLNNVLNLNDNERYTGVYLNNGKNGWVEDTGWNVPVPIGMDFSQSMSLGQCSKNYPYTSFTSRNYPGTYFMDVNGDGLNDMVFHTRAHNYIESVCSNNGFDTEMSKAIYLNNGINGWTKASNIAEIPEFSNDYVAYDNRYSIGEVNGDGLLDVMNSNGNCGPGYPVQESYIYLSQAHPETDLLKTIANPAGGTVNITYESSAKQKDAYGNYLNPALGSVIQIVKTVTYDDGMGTVQTTDYEYQGGKMYLYSNGFKEFGGFGKVTTKDISAVNIVSFYQGNDTPYTSGSVLNYALKGKPYRTEIFDTSGKKYSTSVQTWSVLDLGNSRYFPKLDATVTLTSGDTTHRDTAISYTYDTITGNVIEEKNWGEVSADATGAFTNIGSDEVFALTSYTANTSAWIVGLPSHVTLTDVNRTQKADTTYYYDGSNTLGEVTAGNLTKEEQWLDTTGSYIGTSLTYNSYGLPKTVTNARGYTITIGWDGNYLYPSSITNAKNQTTTFSYNYFNGQLKTSTNPNGAKIQYDYEPFYRVSKVMISDPASASTLKTKEEYVYTDDSLPSSLEIKRYDGINSTPVLSFYYYDGFKRPIQARIQGEDYYSVQDTAYDEKGQVKKASMAYFDSGGAYKTPAWSQAKTENSYDLFGRPKTVSFIKSDSSTYSTTTYGYGTPWQVEIKDANGKKKYFRNDAYGRLKEVDEILNDTTYTTRYSYDTLGSLVTIQDSQGNLRNIGYDSLGKRTWFEDVHASSDTDYGKWFFTYDANSNLATMTDANNAVVQYSYDELDRPLSQNLQGGGSDTAISYTYDTGENGIGYVATATAGSKSFVKYDYNFLGSPKKETKTIDDKEFITQFTVDIAGNPRSVTYPDTTSVSYTYNTAGFLETVNVASPSITTTLVSDIDYSPIGQIAYAAYGNGATETYTYDSNEMYRLRSKMTRKNSTYYQSLAYSVYDKVGNIMQIKDTSNTLLAKTVNYSYDDLYRLTFASANYSNSAKNYSQTYSYDSIGNMTSRSGVGTFAYAGTGNANPHATTSVGAYTLTYDRNGNMLTDGLRTLSYNYRNLIEQAVKNGVTTRFTYDHGGNRILKESSDGKTWYANQFYEERVKGSAEKKYTYIFAGNLRVATIETAINYDGDGDGYTEAGGDCNDSNAGQYPGAAEVCGDGVDQDCSGADLSCNDVDNDGDSYTENGGDCDDAKNSVYPGAAEVCGDGVDQDCSGADLSCSDVDNDGDGYSVNQGDCNDNDASIKPGATETIGDGVDKNCDGKETCYTDSDKDSYSISTTTSSTDLTCSTSNGLKSTLSNPADCNDSSSSINPGATETTGDGVDKNCDGKETCYLDNDDDTYRPNSTSTYASNDTDCTDTHEATSSDATGDCNDNDSSIKPGATEICDSVDNDCDGQTDEGEVCGPTCVTPSTPIVSVDTSDSTKVKFTLTSSNATHYCMWKNADWQCQTSNIFNISASDYSWSDSASSKSLTTYFKSQNRCADGTTKETGPYDAKTSFTIYKYMLDKDADSYRPSDSFSYRSKTQSGGYDDYNTLYTNSGAAFDCNDSSSSINPGATEICGDTLDQDCNGSDIACSDMDNDGDGWTETDGDCDDTRKNVNPEETEACFDGLDNDCDGTVDPLSVYDLPGCINFYMDMDWDGYSSLAEVPDWNPTCQCGPAYFWLQTYEETVAEGEDCIDGNSSIHPGASEICGDEIDQDCSGADLPCPDGDGDGWTTSDGDCDDANAAVHPEAVELCGDEIDNDCDGVEGNQDLDADGRISTSCGVFGFDCNDSNAGIYRGKTEICADGIDQDCSGADVKCGDPDNDKDGYREVDGDCDDTNKLIFPGPGAKEKCGDFVDQNCDGYEKVCVTPLPTDIFERIFPEIEKPGGSWSPIGAWSPMGLENLRKAEQWVASLISTLTTVASVILSARTERSAVRRNKTIREANTLPDATASGSEGSQYENNTGVDRVAFTTPSTLGASSPASTDQYSPAEQNSKAGFSTTTVALYYTFGDHLGSSSVTLDASGNLVQATDYFPYGGANVDEKYGSFANPYTYTGKELDSEVALYYYGARYYNAGFSRFTSIDPALMDPQHLLKILADPQSLNSYAYARNNPIRFIDPNGNTFWDALKTWGGILGNTVLEMLDIIPGTGDISDVYASHTGKTLFTQQELSQDDLAITMALATEPVITGGQARFVKEIPDDLKKVVGKTRSAVQQVVEPLAKNVSGITAKQAQNLYDRLIHLKINGEFIVNSVKAFGSRTKGTAKATSDLDIAVIINDVGRHYEKNDSKQWARIQSIFNDIETNFKNLTNIDLHLIPTTWRDMAAHKKFKSEDLRLLE